MKKVRKEEEVMQDLEELASSPGYLHAIAFLCFRDNFVTYTADATPEQFAKLYSDTRLIRTEISTLIGLTLKHTISWDLPGPSTIQIYIDKTESLLEELHDTLNAPMFEIFKLAAKDGISGEDPFSSGSILREAVFYGAESAYSFQYRDFSLKKYENDDEWLYQNKGFHIAEARTVAQAMGNLVTNNLLQLFEAFMSINPDEWTVLPAFLLSSAEIAATTNLPIVTVENVMQAFSVPAYPCNEEFRHLNDFNIYNAYPLITKGAGSYLCLQQHSILEALYETPFYWMLSDKTYSDRATANRGAFLERLAQERLELVFGPDRTWSNVLIVDSQGNIAAEIDTLVIFGNRAIVVQAKSKRMTLGARKGNDSIIQSDFAKSIQASYNQGLRCAELIGKQGFRLVLDTGEELVLPSPSIDRTYIFCLVSDHYPALSAQSRQFLKTQATEHIPAPFVMDVFLLDAMSEMLNSPLYFLSYVDRRVHYNDRVMASHELTILSYHLKLNLWVDNQYNLIQLADDIATDLDLAMMVRRDGVDGKSTPDGILTHAKGTTFERIIQQIDQDPRENAVDLGLFLLSLSGETATQISRGIDRLSAQAKIDGAPHDFTIAAGDGLTVHINQAPIADAEIMLRRHCERKKYQQRAKRWFGILMLPDEAIIRLIGKLDFKWRRNERIEAEIAALPGTKMFTRPRAEGGKKVGRNDPCPCGSGRKFKKCCI